jgi:hypothetical protein
LISLKRSASIRPNATGGRGPGPAEQFLAGDQFDRPAVRQAGQGVGQGHLLQDLVLDLKLLQGVFEFPGPVLDPAFEVGDEPAEVVRRFRVVPFHRRPVGFESVGAARITSGAAVGVDLPNVSVRREIGPPARPGRGGCAWALGLAAGRSSVGENHGRGVKKSPRDRPMEGFRPCRRRVRLGGLGEGRDEFAGISSESSGESLNAPGKAITIQGLDQPWETDSGFSRAAGRRPSARPSRPVGTGENLLRGCVSVGPTCLYATNGCRTGSVMAAAHCQMALPSWTAPRGCRPAPNERDPRPEGSGRPVHRRAGIMPPRGRGCL